MRSDRNDPPRFESLQNLDGHFTVSERRYHDRHHIILQVIENFVPYNPWICYAEVDGAPDAKAFYIAASCPEVSSSQLLVNGGGTFVN